MRKLLRYSTATAATGLYAAAAFVAWNDKEVRPLVPDYRKIAAVSAVMAGLTWIAALA